ncbi:MAG: ankyrin repeat domain-containing protein [Acidobacteria bacterium]|nr:ankyrin repeat domain-containing protein [Acidobacteriota bacterium]
MPQLRALIDAIAHGNDTLAAQLLAATPSLAACSSLDGATRQTEKPYFLPSIVYIYAGDTPLHIAAAAYSVDMVRKLIAVGANPRSCNRHGAEPIHSASAGIPGAPYWNPTAQTATIGVLVQSGADPNARDKHGVAPLHRAVRTRCAAAVQTLLEHGADPTLANNNGSTPLVLATHTTAAADPARPKRKRSSRKSYAFCSAPVRDSRRTTNAAKTSHAMYTASTTRSASPR